ncbi:heterokaryon incompatibility protein [Seiridium cupressi]
MPSPADHGHQALDLRYQRRKLMETFEKAIDTKKIAKEAMDDHDEVLHDLTTEFLDHLRRTASTTSETGTQTQPSLSMSSVMTTSIMPTALDPNVERKDPSDGVEQDRLEAQNNGVNSAHKATLSARIKQPQETTHADPQQGDTFHEAPNARPCGKLADENTKAQKVPSLELRSEPESLPQSKTTNFASLEGVDVTTRDCLITNYKLRALQEASLKSKNIRRGLAIEQFLTDPKHPASTIGFSILAAEGGKDDTILSLECEAFDYDEFHEYAVLSYEDSLPVSENGKEILIDGTIVVISQDLWWLLRTLRDSKVTFLCWAGELLVPFSAEKTEYFFGHTLPLTWVAPNIFIGVGAASWTSNIAVQSLRHHKKIFSRDEATPEILFRLYCIHEFICRPWFKRLQSMVELLLGDPCQARIVCCGSSFIHLSDIVDFCKSWNEDTWKGNNGRLYKKLVTKKPFFDQAPVLRQLSRYPGMIDVDQLTEEKASLFRWLRIIYSSNYSLGTWKDPALILRPLATAMYNAADVPAAFGYVRPSNLMCKPWVNTWTAPFVSFPEPDWPLSNIPSTEAPFKAGLSFKNIRWPRIMKPDNAKGERTKMERAKVETTSVEDRPELKATIWGLLFDEVQHASEAPWHETMESGKLRMDSFTKDLLVQLDTSDEVQSNGSAAANFGYNWEITMATAAGSLWRTLVCDRDFEGAKAPDKFKAYYKQWMSKQESIKAIIGGNSPQELQSIASEFGYDKEDDSNTVYKFVKLVLKRCHERSFIVCKSGRIGLAVRGVAPGDRVFIMRGGSAPLVLRKSGTEWNMVGEAYISGLMDGEAVDLALQEKMVQKKITLK